MSLLARKKKSETYFMPLGFFFSYINLYYLLKMFFWFNITERRIILNNRKKPGKKKENQSNNSIIDFIGDMLFWIPELLLLPFRLVIFLFRSAGKLIRNIFDFI